jgi:predicted ATPase
MLHFLGLANYKNLQPNDEKVCLKKLNIFVGSNGSGKSNFISCLQFLHNSLTNIGESNSHNNNFEQAISTIGNYKILDINSAKNVNIVRISYCFFFELENFSINYFILDLIFLGKREDKKVFLTKEFLYNNDQLIEYSDEDVLFLYKLRINDESFIAVHQLRNSNDSFDLEKLNDVPTNTLGLAVLPQLLENSDFSLKDIPAYQVRGEFIREISRWKFYNSNNMDLYKIRTSEPKIGSNDIYLSSSGDNLALVIENLSQDIDFEDTLNIAMKAILPQTRRVRSARSGRLSLTIEWFFEGNKEPFYLDEMSDGTVRMLCWATILYSPHLPTLLVIDEPELGLHVAWMPILAEWIKQASQKTQIIITTHSPDLLDHFTDCLDNVLCFQRKDNQHFTINPLDKTSLQPRLEEGWQLGDLYRVGDPSVGGWPW